MTAPLASSWLTGLVHRHFPAGAAPDPVSFRAVLEGCLTGNRKARGKLYAAREETVAEIGELFGITRESCYRYIRAGKAS